MENKIVRFGELYQIPSSNGLSRPSAVRGIGFKMINMGELFANNIISDIPMERVQMSESEQKKFFVEQGDLLFARQSLVAEGAGKCSIIKLFNEPTTFESHLIRVRLNQKIANPWYYYYLFQLKSNPIKAIINQCAQAGIRGSELARVKVPNPPLPTQQKIASILSAYDNLIQNYKKQIEALQTAASELYKEWFIRFRFPGWKNAEFENGIPEEWKVEKLGNLANISTGKCNREDAEDDGIYPLFDRSQEIKKSNEWIKDCEAIIVPGEGTSFIPRYYKGKFNLHQRCYCVEPKYPDFGKFLFYVLMLNRKYFLSVATGATVPSLRYNNFASMKFILPEISLCNNFNKIANDIFAKVDNLQQQISNLTQQRDLLLPRLMSGKLEV